MQTIPVLPINKSAPQLPLGLAKDDALWDAAKKLEATFLSEMLKSAGLGASKGAFGGGIGEEQFSSFLRESQANKMVEAGGIGLAESIYNAMRSRSNE